MQDHLLLYYYYFSPFLSLFFPYDMFKGNLDIASHICIEIYMTWLELGQFKRLETKMISKRNFRTIMTI